VITVGVDLAAEPKKTGVAWLEWLNGRARVVDVVLGASDEDLVTAMSEGEKTGIDCPLGWPIKFIDFIGDHQKGPVEALPELEASQWRRELCYRVTDLHVKKLGIQGLSVSTDRIGVTTMRCAALLSMLAARRLPVDRTGAGPVVEVYPAASLLVWGLPYRGYKQKKGLAGLHALVDALKKKAGGWLELGGYEELCRSSDDAFDAVVAAITARAAATGRVEEISFKYREVAAVEGWIALPNTDLGVLSADIA
jgi:predicted nuclease with RNAse H fold